MRCEPLSICFSIEKDIETQFGHIADRLMNEVAVVVDETRFRLTEIEFYLFHPDKHPDPFVHCNERQKTSMQWYFHESGYGVDLTFGCDEYYGGILIRGLRNIQSGEPYSGPWKSMYALLSAMKGAEVQQSKRFVIEMDSREKRCEVKKTKRKNLWLPGTITKDMLQCLVPLKDISVMKNFNDIYINHISGVFKRKERMSQSKNKKNIEDIHFFKEYYDKEYGYWVEDER